MHRVLLILIAQLPYNYVAHFLIAFGFLGMNFNMETTREDISIKMNSMYITNASRDVLTYSRPAHIFYLYYALHALYYVIFRYTFIFSNVISKGTICV